MSLCIPKNINKQLKILFEKGNFFKKGKMDSDKFLKMSSQEREDFLGKYLKENNKPLPDIYKKEINKQIVSHFKTELTEEQFEIISKRYKTLDEIKETSGVNFFDSTEDIIKYNDLDDASKLKFEKEQSAINEKWAREFNSLNNEMEELINPNSKLEWWEQGVNIAKSEYRKITDIDKSTLSGVFRTGGQIASSTFNLLTTPMLKSIKASVDASYALRQGFGTLIRDPKLWKENILESAKIWKNIGSRKALKQAMDEFKIKTMSDPFYDLIVKRGKTAIGVAEDIFPETVLEKTGGLGNILKGSNEAFTVFIQGSRYGLAKDLIKKQMKLVEGELTTAQLKDIGTLANTWTGRGGLGRLEASSGTLNRLFFSARYIRSQTDIFTMPFNPSLNEFARKEAMKHSGIILGSIAALIATAKISGLEVELDPRSTYFGRVTVPGSENKIDLTAGLGSYIAVFTKAIATGEYKNSKGKIIKLNDPKAYKGASRVGVAGDFLTNKLAPGPSVIYNALGKGELFGGKEPTVGNITRELTVPITVDNWYEYFTNEELTPALISAMGDFLGANVTSRY